MTIHGQSINSLNFIQLKNIRDVEVTFAKTGLTAIMGVNGSGKSTILHALACCYKPLISKNRHDWKFTEFLPPNADALWRGSSFTMSHNFGVGAISHTNIIQTYAKLSDRWAPKYDRRPSRHVSYIGIRTCVPVIELETRQSFIGYSTTPLASVLAIAVKEKAGIILNRNYNAFNLCKTARYEYIGVEHEGNRYSALSMGAGEQRVFKILEEVFDAPKNSLVLIDEIDLLLHVTALKKLLKVLDERAKAKELQIIFTTHSPVVFDLADSIEIRYIYQTPLKTLILTQIKPDIIYNLTGENDRPLNIYVEDDLAKAIVKRVCQELHMSRYVSVLQYGPAQNCFTVAGGLIIEGKDVTNTLFLLDGDKFSSEEERRNQVNRVVTGTLRIHQEMRELAFSKIDQFNPSGMSPEKYIFYSILDVTETSEIQDAAFEIVTVDDDHKFVDEIINILGEERLSGLKRIIDLVSTTPKWKPLIQTLEDWLISKTPIVREQVLPAAVLVEVVGSQTVTNTQTA